VFVGGKPFQLSLLFARKARAYLSETPFKCSTHGQALTSTKWPAMNKRSSLLINCGCNCFITLGQGEDGMSGNSSPLVPLEQMLDRSELDLQKDQVEKSSKTLMNEMYKLLEIMAQELF